MHERALHNDFNHIHLTGALPAAATAELIGRANVLMRTGSEEDSSPIFEGRKAATPVVYLNSRHCPGEIEEAPLQVLRSLQIARPQYEGASPALVDGADDVIRLYKEIAGHPVEPNPLPAGYEWPSMGWGL
jgi:hypothetical protein